MFEPTNLETILRTGQLVGGQYRVDGLIAKGGMAAVWAGVNQHTGKRVALKVILRSFAANSDAAELFRREALAASRINHPNVVNVFDVIDHEDKTCIVMEMLDGETLASYLARAGPLSPEATVALLLPAMRGVAAANAQGVIHRDLKPANIFLCSDADGRLLTTKVFDFGISVMMGLAGEASGETAPLAKFGTPAYMAPEAIEMSPNIDGRADVYGFGVLCFEALTGKLPFPGPAGLELLGRILTDPAPKVTLYRPDLPSAVVQLVDCALAKEPGNRFADMEHLIRATECLQQALPRAPRALTLVPGSSALASAGSHAGTKLPSAPGQLTREPSASPCRSGTSALYSLAREPRGATDGPRSAPGRSLARATHTSTARREPRSRGGYRRRIPRRFAIGAGLAVLLLVTAWVTVPASSRDSGVEPRHSSGSAEPADLTRGPLVIPLPSPSRSAPSPIASAETFVKSLPTTMSISANGKLVRTPTPETHTAARATMHTTDPSVPRVTPHPAKRVARGKPMTQPPPLVDVPESPFPSRAGRLSRSDF